MKKTMLPTAIVAVGFLFAALPTVAAAATPEMDFSHALPVGFSGTFGQANLTTTGSTLTCKGENHVSGEFETSKTARISVTYTGCEISGGIKCQNGVNSGEIKEGPSTLHLVYIKEDVNGTQFVKTPGVLITTTSTVEFKCSLVTVKETGPGTLGHLEGPACGGQSRSASMAFESNSPGVQTYQKIEGSELIWDKKADIGGGASETSSLDATTTIQYEEAVEGTLTCP